MIEMFWLFGPYLLAVLMVTVTICVALALIMTTVWLLMLMAERGF